LKSVKKGNREKNYLLCEHARGKKGKDDVAVLHGWEKGKDFPLFRNRETRGNALSVIRGGKFRERKEFRDLSIRMRKSLPRGDQREKNSKKKRAAHVDVQGKKLSNDKIYEKTTNGGRGKDYGLPLSSTNQEEGDGHERMAGKNKLKKGANVEKGGLKEGEGGKAGISRTL